MIKIIIAFIVGIIIGGGATFGVISISGNKVAKVNAPPQIAKSVPSTSPLPSQETQMQQNLEKLRSELYQQGITVSAKVDKVYQGVGFILLDNTGVRLFVHWTKDNVTQGQTVSAKGTIKQLSTSWDEIKKDPGYNQDLDTFLKEQKIFIEAQNITSS